MARTGIYAEAAGRYRPAVVRLLWIAERPPSVGPGGERRYFYFEEMTRHDSLFREIMRAMFPLCTVPYEGQSKRDLLVKFRDAGAFLIDVCEEPSIHSYERGWETAGPKVVVLNPERIIAVKADVCDFVGDALAKMGLSDRLLIRGMVPFPGSGQQRRFHRAVDSVVREWLGCGQCEQSG